jgi:xanthosine utilization system XapX-like protein
MAAGGSISVSLLFAIVSNPTTAVVAMTALVGVIIGEAVRQTIP